MSLKQEYAETLVLSRDNIFPARTEDEDLAQRVMDGGAQFSNILPLLEELRLRFADPKRTVPIRGCDTWYGFIEKKLGFKPSRIRKALAKERKKKKLEPFFKELANRLHLIRPAISDGQEHVLIEMLNRAEIEKPVSETEEWYQQEIITSLEFISKDFASRAEKLRSIRIAEVV